MNNRNLILSTVFLSDTLPANWIQLIESLNIPSVISPLHDCDVNPFIGDILKPHYHVIFIFEGNKSPEFVREVFSPFCNLHFDIVKNLRNYARYLCSLDSPIVSSYKVSDVICFGSINYFDLISI